MENEYKIADKRLRQRESRRAYLFALELCQKQRCMLGTHAARSAGAQKLRQKFAVERLEVDGSHVEHGRYDLIVQKSV